MSYSVVSLTRGRTGLIKSWVDNILKQTIQPEEIFIGIDEDDHIDYIDNKVTLIYTSREELGWVRRVTPAVESSESMARMRNSVVNAAFNTSVDYVLTCDSDVFPESTCAQKMIGFVEGTDTGGVVCAPVRNTDRAYDVFMNFNNDGLHYNRLTRDCLNTGIIPVASGGACCMIERVIWEAGARYCAHPQCENVGFGESINHIVKDGYWCDTSIHTDHMVSDITKLSSH